MADGFHIDGNGNLWIGSTSNTFDSNAPFYVETDGTMKASSGTFSGDISGASGTFTGDLSGADISGGTIDIGSGTFQVDSSGNLTATSATITGAVTATSGSFTGSISSTSGTIGGWTIGSTDLSSGNISIDSTGEISADYSSSTGWKLEADGDAFFNSVDIRIGSSVTQNPSTGFTTLDIGTAKLSEYNDDLWISAERVMIYDSDGTASANSPSLFLFAAYGQPGWYVDDSQINRTKLYYSNGVNNVFHTESDNTYLHLESGTDGIKIGTDQGGNSQYIGKNSSGSFGWHNLPTGNTHPDSDHTSFISQSDADTRYVLDSQHTHSNLIGDTAFNNHANSSTAHGTFDNYSYWRPRINGSNISGSIGSTQSLNFVAGSNMTISEGGSGGTRNITFTASGGGATTTSSSLDTSTTSGAGYFARHMSISGSTLTYYRSAKGSNLYVLAPRPTSNNSSSVGISTQQYNEIHARYGYFDFITGGNVSSQEVKTDITDLDLGLDFINALVPKKYKYKPELKEDDGKYGWGFIAEDVETTLSNIGESNSKFYEEGRTDYESYGRCAHEFICTCDDSECCPEPITEVDTETGEVTETGCMKDNSCMQPCCTDIAGSTIDGKNYVHASEEECEQVFIDGRKHSSLKKEELVAPLVKAIQELSTQVSDLTARIETLEG